MCHDKLTTTTTTHTNNSDSKPNESLAVAQRRSRRRTFSENQIEEEQALAEALDHPDCRQNLYKALYKTEIGCGLYTSKPIKKGDVVIEFKGQLITRAEGLSLERYLETQEPSPENDAYIFFFDFPIGGRAYALLVDQNDLSYFINHSYLKPNLTPKATILHGKIRIYFVASKNIGLHEQLFYDYGDNQSESLKNYPWLKTT